MCLPMSNPQTLLGKGEHLGFEWEVLNANGHRCGYIKVLPGHPWFGKSYSCSTHWDDDRAEPHVCSDFDANVHGGITFANHGTECPTHGKADEWWVGFDTAHCDDLDDPELMSVEKRAQEDSFALRFGRHGVVRSQEYVESECRSLCQQAAAALAAH